MRGNPATGGTNPTNALKVAWPNGDHSSVIQKLERANHRSAPFVAVSLVVVGLVGVPLAIVSAILGHVPARGALLAAALLFATSWIALTIRYPQRDYAAPPPASFRR